MAHIVSVVRLAVVAHAFTCVEDLPMVAIATESTINIKLEGPDAFSWVANSDPSWLTGKKAFGNGPLVCNLIFSTISDGSGKKSGHYWALVPNMDLEPPLPPSFSDPNDFGQG